MCQQPYISGTEAKFIFDFRFSIFESKSELPNTAGINRRTDGTTASRARRTHRRPLRTCTTAPQPELSRVKLPSFTSENKKTAQPNIRFNGDWNSLWRPGRNDLLVLLSELNCPIAITNLNFHLYYRRYRACLSRIFRTKIHKLHKSLFIRRLQIYLFL